MKPREILRKGSLLVISTLWSFLSLMARALASWGILDQTQLPTRVISVGNIQVGGAGKTPLVAQIANEAAQQGLQVCILCRGYQGEWEDVGGVISPTEQHLNVVQCGDEAALLHKLCPQAWIGVGADRVGQYRHVVDQAHKKIDLVILDDGFQHWKIKKDLELIALTSARRGDVIFRDFRWALQKAHLLVWTKGTQKPQTYGRPCVRVQYRLPPPQSSLPLWFVSGLEDVSSLYALALARESGYTIVKHLPFPDHTQYTQDAIRALLKQAETEKSRIALTGKDWVKWKDLGVSPTDVIVFEPELVFVEGKELWSKTLWGK